MPALSSPISFKNVNVRTMGYSKEAPFTGTTVAKVIFDDFPRATKMVHMGSRVCS